MIPTTYSEMRAHAEALRQRADDFEVRSSRRFDSAPGAFVTGGSGRCRSGLAKKTARAIDGSLADLARAKKLRERAATWSARADRLDPSTVGAAAKRREAREEAAARAKSAESERRKAAPILNRPPCGERLTAIEWSRLPGDYKSLAVIEIDGTPCRVRTAIRGGALVEVYLTDRRERVTP
jgi:hypothetical protein